MRRLTMKVLSTWLLAAVVASGCGKKPAGTPSAAAPEEQKDGVSSVPTPTERSADMELSNLPISGDVKEVKAKVLDKEADDKAKGLVRIKAFNGPVEISENTRWEVWKPGADTEEQKPESNGWASSERAVPAGTWDIRMHYEESPVCRAEGWIRGVNVVAGKMWKAEAALSTAMQYVRIFATLDGKDVADNALVEIFKAGADQEELKPLASFWSTRKQPMASTTYDLRLSYNKDGVKAKAAVKGFTVGGDHGVLKKTIALTKT
jgi:hypothetical protein